MDISQYAQLFDKTIQYGVYLLQKSPLLMSKIPHKRHDEMAKETLSRPEWAIFYKKTDYEYIGNGFSGRKT